LVLEWGCKSDIEDGLKEYVSRGRGANWSQVYHASRMEKL
jgi:hypothetical protein